MSLTIINTAQGAKSFFYLRTQLPTVFYSLQTSLSMRFLLFGLLYLYALSLLNAQECVPSPGPAIFGESFGSGPNPGMALPSGTTSHAYGSINEGHYLISNTTDLNPGFWHAGLDHTEGDTDGYMLLLNAAEGPGTFYQKTFTDLCPNTNYIISCFIANIVVPVACIGIAEKPDIQFTVINPDNETIQASNATGEIFYSSFLDWLEYTLQFRTAPDQTSILFQLTNNAPSGCGNDLAIDDISLRFCNIQQEQSFDLCDLPDGSLTVGTSTYTEPGIYLDALPIANSCNDTLITTTLTGTTRLLPTLSYAFCQGDTLELAGRRFTTSTSFVDTLVGPMPDCPRFQPYEIVAQSLLSLTQDITLCQGDRLLVGNNSYDSAGTYVDTLSTAAGCDSVVTTNITTGAIDVGITPATIEVELGQTVQLMSTVTLSNDFNLSWQPTGAFSCTDCPAPLLQPTASGTYQLLATDILSGCTDSAAVEVRVLTCDKVFVPNAFSPNFDGVNDQLSVFAEGCFTRLISWRIFDRWGGQVYETADQPLSGGFIAWGGQTKGQPAAQGIYGYHLILERDNGTRMSIRGEVMLLR